MHTSARARARTHARTHACARKQTCAHAHMHARTLIVRRCIGLYLGCILDPKYNFIWNMNLRPLVRR